MLKLNHVTVSFNQNSVLHQLNLHVKMGEFAMVIGSNGAGKSTLFNTIAGSIIPVSGTIVLEDCNITKDPQVNRCKNIATVMQDPRVGTIEQMTIYQNLAFAHKRSQKRHLIPYKSQDLRDLFADHLKMLNMGLEDQLDTMVANLSGGQRQAISLIMATLAPSKLLLLDEITAALDPNMSDRIMELTNSIIRTSQKTCLMITHDMNHALKYGDRIIVLKKGCIAQEFIKDQDHVVTAQQLTALL